ncbi:phytanoyl-CoA dioxygenase family protein [Silvimonas iriomotensis]|uniref:Phytanoyl-CoA dioxygenase (PhyH) n=1 Tax=Silvimonas iriomotensis TaxID=449662 RepID=A0ABQ2PBI7_9NEIS|nr:phytanoyl-CoA dioxygenase family protein [Silvimonas iriomotensis]GGP22743.1 hypothetical protein GCM10010970_27430 [Silvimonas iriomotensis]
MNSSSFYGGFAVERLRDPAFWQQLAPTLHVADQTFWDAQPPLALSEELIATLAERTIREGYFQADPVDWQLPIVDMATVIHTLRQMQIPPVLAFVYDEFWLVYVKMGALLARILGDDYVTLPNMWAWHIDPAQNEHGWKPHRDRGRISIFEDGRPRILNIWLPLSDATPLNGCMYLVPADRDPTYNTPDEMSMQYQLHDIRALPAPAGSMLGWNQAVLHWGSHSAPRDVPPRISIGAEFQRADIAPFSEPWLNPTAMPTFMDRLLIAAAQFGRYRHHHPDDAGLAWLAEHLAP